jgi:Cyanobacterial TRADD-N associated 2-Transmembrane domain
MSSAGAAGTPPESVTDPQDLITHRTQSEEEISGPGDSFEAAEAARREAWRNSSELKRLRRTSFLLLVGLSPIGAAIGVIIVWILEPSSEPPRTSVLLSGALLGVFTWEYFALYALFFLRRQVRRAFNDRVILGLAQTELREAEQDISEGDTDFASLWKATQKRLDYYHKIATSQSERSFLYSQIAAGTGFLVVLVSALAASLARSTTASIAAGLVGIAGGGLGGYIGATFIKSQETATTQLREYFLQPLEFSKYLAAERLVSTLSDQDRSAAVAQIIGAITRNSGPDSSAPAPSPADRRGSAAS